MGPLGRTATSGSLPIEGRGSIGRSHRIATGMGRAVACVNIRIHGPLGGDWWRVVVEDVAYQNEWAAGRGRDVGVPSLGGRDNALVVVIWVSDSNHGSAVEGPKSGPPRTCESSRIGGLGAMAPLLGGNLHVGRKASSGPLAMTSSHRL
jgi:hypothetical protein